MPNLIAMSFEGDLAPSFDLRCLHAGRKPPDGWGIGYYPGGESAAAVLKEAAPPPSSIRSELVKVWEHLASPLFLLHIRTARWGQLSAANTQPFLRTWGGRDWLMGHSGSLQHRIELGDSRPAVFQPVGSTDTEIVFCDLLNQLAARGWRAIGDADPETLWSWLDALNVHGNLAVAFTDGLDLCVYADSRGEGRIHVWQLQPPHREVAFADGDLAVDLTRRGIKSRKGVIVSSSVLEATAGEPIAWEQLEPGRLLIVRQGAVRADVGGPKPRKARARSTSVIAVGVDVTRPEHAPVKRLSVTHRTIYRYAREVERSTHLLRLIPAHDHRQSLLESAISVSVDGPGIDFEDVFGNRVRRVLLDQPYSELIIDARSRVELLDTDPLNFSPLSARTTIPLVWMPGQQHTLQPFLLPPELPESELVELFEYAMSFVVRNGYSLLDTLLDLNSSIYKEYAYRQGTTMLATTPFQVYAQRRGVCQDFTNLFMCLVRLLGIPARYVCGYVYTGPAHGNQRQSDASHAWAQVYLPEIGWRGFDPTNGILTQTDHVRVAVGRTSIDATPTSGTIYVGGGGESLDVEVRVEPIPSA